MPDKRYTKVEEEIIQILDRLEDEQPVQARNHLRLVHATSKRRRGLAFRKPQLSRTRPAWIWLALAFALAGVAYLLRDTSSTIAMMFAIASAGAFFGPLFARGPSHTVPTGPSTTKTWRGKDITLSPPPTEGTSERARRWLDDRRGGGGRLR